MKILTLSDSHNKHRQIPEKYLKNEDGSISMIIHAGDVSGRGSIDEIVSFLEWFNVLPFDYKIFCPGNHDFYFEDAKPEEIINLLSQYPNVIYLHDSGIEILGFKLWGSGVTPWFYAWAFNRKGIEIKPHWDMIPDDINLLITHGPAKGYLDLTMGGDSVGCPYLLEKISELKNLSLFISGHVHEGYGKVIFPDGGVFVNASVLNHRYEMRNKPYLITLDDISKKVISIE
jgi:Icc-related predicted phosphoesterase